jgi:hypothetical protein
MYVRIKSILGEHDMSTVCPELTPLACSVAAREFDKAKTSLAESFTPSRSINVTASGESTHVLSQPCGRLTSLTNQGYVLKDGSKDPYPKSFS